MVAKVLLVTGGNKGTQGPSMSKHNETCQDE